MLLLGCFAIRPVVPRRAALGCLWLVAGWLVAGWPVAVDDLPVGAVGGGGGVGVQDEAPAAAVDAGVVVELAQKDAIRQGCLAAVLLVAQVVDVAVNGPLGAAGPFAAALGAQLDGAADVRRGCCWTRRRRG